MTKATHTPGPWSYRKAGNGDCGIGKSPGILLAECFVDIRSHGENSAQECEANARLIAAAPDMLEALEAATECGLIPKSSVRDGGASSHPRQVVVADMIRAAIAKARGEA